MGVGDHLLAADRDPRHGPRWPTDHRGDRVGLYYKAANFDPDVVGDPRSFDVRRGPNPHLAFGGGGIHHCLGAFLARLETRMLVEEIVRRDVRFELTGTPVRVRSNLVSGFESIPVRAVPR